MRIVGVDLASRPQRSALCVLDWHERPRVVALHRPADDDRILHEAAAADAVGIDSPFGWPTPFVDLVARHHRGEPTRTVDATLRDLRLRRTDQWIRRWIPRDPLSVSTDRIGVVALRAVGLVERMRGPGADRSGRDGLFEVYPGGSLARWDIPSTGYKSGDGAPVRERIVAAVAPFVDLAGVHDRVVGGDDELDAVITALVTGLAVAGRTTAAPPECRREAAVEGWIHVPTGPITDLAEVVLTPSAPS
jgi:predicted nuclease with RNAse H fold